MTKSAIDTHPDKRTRKQHLEILKSYKRAGNSKALTAYWLGYCPKISRTAINNL